MGFFLRLPPAFGNAPVSRTDGPIYCRQLQCLPYHRRLVCSWFGEYCPPGETPLFPHLRLAVFITLSPLSLLPAAEGRPLWQLGFRRDCHDTWQANGPPC